jgi:hypothetical protein
MKRAKAGAILPILTDFLELLAYPMTWKMGSYSWKALSED